MGLFRRRHDGRFIPDVPDAAPAADPRDEVVELVVMVAGSHGYTCAPLDEHGLTLTKGSGDFQLGLTNLRQRLAAEPRSDWPAMVADFVSAVVVGYEQRLEMDDFTLVRPLVRSRFYGADQQISANFAALEAAPGLLEVIVVDRPTTVVLAPYADVAGWGRDAGELFTLGRGNVRADPFLEHDEHDVDGVRISRLSGETFYASTHLHWLGDYFPVGVAGALVALPNRHTILAHPIWDMSAAAAVGALRGLAQRLFDEGPGSISPEVYWWHGGPLTLVRTELAVDGRLNVFPDAEFTAALNRLAAT